MSKEKRRAGTVTKLSDYLKLFPDDKESKSEKMRYLALKEAQEIRKFEIELYWKRTGFFWAFITVIYTALFAVLCKYLDCPCKYSFFVPSISALSGLGFFFSVAWHMVNKGSKFWQKNWENHVSLLERNEIGPLYDVFLNPKTTGSRWNPTEEFDFSVTKVNMWASTLISIISFAGCFFCSFWLFIYSNHNYLSVIPSGLIGIFTIIIFIGQRGNKDIEISDSEEADLNMIHRK
ncbi:MAG: hypothetical protein IJ828_06685 [Treponema sp.]|nr:hypothetical protein [Treponema sp.]